MMYYNQFTQPQLYGQNFAQNYTPQQNQDERLWVQNETAAESYPIAPGSFVRLWDSQKPVFYEKRADATGRPYPLDVYEYARRKPQEASEMATATNTLAEDIKALELRITALEGKKNGGRKKDEQSNPNDAGIPEV